VRETLERDPRDAEAQLLAGMLELAAGDAPAAVASLRRALYVEPTWALAAFQLGRAHDALGDDMAARRAYRQTLASLDPDDERSAGLPGALAVADIAAACRDRLRR
jgi:predicted TPR repeat methyltransferase